MAQLMRNIKEARTGWANPRRDKRAGAALLISVVVLIVALFCAGHDATGLRSGGKCVRVCVCACVCVCVCMRTCARARV